VAGCLSRPTRIHHNFVDVLVQSEAFFHVEVPLGMLLHVVDYDIFAVPAGVDKSYKKNREKRRVPVGIDSDRVKPQLDVFQSTQMVLTCQEKRIVAESLKDTLLGVRVIQKMCLWK
jgi:hypothetical protein